MASFSQAAFSRFAAAESPFDSPQFSSAAVVIGA